MMCESGCRSETICDLRLEHIQLLSGVHNSVHFALPHVKTVNGGAITKVFAGKTGKSLIDWLTVRNRMSTGIPFIFVTMKGTKITSKCICMMFAELSMLAGPPEGFFTGHSPRAGFVARIPIRSFLGRGTRCHERNVNKW